MSIRILTVEEIPNIVDGAEGFYNEFYADNGVFNRSHFESTWASLTTFGQAITFMEYDATTLIDRGVFGAVRGHNLYTGEAEYIGMFTAILPQFRGQFLILTFMEEVHEFIRTLGVPVNIYLSSRVAKLEAIWKRLGYDPDSHRYVRRIEL